MDSSESQPSYQDLRTNPLGAVLTARLTIRDPGQGNDGMDFETFPPSDANAWNIDSLFAVGGIPRVSGVYVFEQRGIGGFKILSYPPALQDKYLRMLQLAFASIMAKRSGELIDLFARFPEQADLELVATDIVEVMHRPSMLQTLLSEEPSKPFANIKVIASCPHRNALDTFLEGRPFEQMLSAAVGSLTALLLTKHKVNWTPRNNGTEVHVSLQDHGHVFGDYVNGALAQELTKLLKVKTRDVARAFWKQMRASATQTDAKVNAFAKQWEFDDKDL